ncbi:hypothetical protein N7532_000142 [Penicillium argentinense]|uniref:Type 1 phosphatases regulator n=1 Tax=Penicillium argentinense TaxID=1131581 RepID=A0A9W9KNK6_9EURO|nr:uncharacterized protein N7532_000142 [Penicillium argentinense]KAJ5112097.1 hypothetical protein N7532_000142 [Penicillium argentinense]
MSRSRQPGSNPQIQSTTETSRDSSVARLSGTLRLRGDDTSSTSEPSTARHIRWSEDVVDNEGMGKKSSKGNHEIFPPSAEPQSLTFPVCCIYHKARPVGESSSESESSSSSSDSDSESDNEIDRRRLRAKHSRSRGRKPTGDGPEKSPVEGQADCCAGHGPQRTKQKRRKPSPNAYEKMPKPSKPPSQGS